MTVFKIAQDEFVEADHPRDNSGKFAKAPGGGAPTGAANEVKQAQVSSTITGIMKAAGYKKQSTPGPGNTAVYYNPSNGAKVLVHPAPEGKKWSSKWTSSVPGKEDKHGEGSSLAQLLRVAAKKAEEKAAEATSKSTEGILIDYSGMMLHDAVSAIYKVGFKFVSQNGETGHFTNETHDLILDKKTKIGTLKKKGEGSSVKSSEVSKEKYNAQVDKLKSQGFEFKGVSSNSLNNNSIHETIFNKGDMKIQLSTTGNEEWVVTKPGFSSKEGKGFENLDKLMSGDGSKLPNPPWKTTNKVIQTKAEKDAMTAEQKKAQEAYIEQQKKNAEKIAQAKIEAEKQSKLYNELRKLAPQPTNEESKALGFYGGSGYTHLNSNLRHDHKYADKEPMVKNLDAYLAKSEIIEEITVYRGVKGEYAKILKSVVTTGSKFIDRGFMSTSTNKGIADNFESGLLMKIKVPKGARGAAIADYSGHPNEKEVLLPRNSTLTVTAYDPDTGLIEVELEHTNK